MQSVKNYFKDTVSTRSVLAASARLVLAASARLVLAVSKVTKLPTPNVKGSVSKLTPKTLSDELNTFRSTLAPHYLVYQKSKRFPALFGEVLIRALTTGNVCVAVNHGVSILALTTGV